MKIKRAVIALATLTMLGSIVPTSLHAANWGQTAKILPFDGTPNPDYLSTFINSAATALDGNTLVVGAMSYTRGLPAPEIIPPGVVYVIDADSGEVRHQLSPTDRNEPSFGGRVAVDGEKIVVAAPTSRNRRVTTPSMYVYDAVSGEQLQYIPLPFGISNSTFFYRFSPMAFDGDTIVVGAPSDDENGLNAGAVYLYDAVTGQQLKKLMPSDPSEKQDFGAAVAIDDRYIVIGAPGDLDLSIRRGAIYIFDASTGAQIRKITAFEDPREFSLGTLVAIDGTTIAASGFGNGPVYLFDAQTGERSHRLLPTDQTSGDSFPTALTIDGKTLVVGASRDSDNGVLPSNPSIGAGAAYVFDTVNGNQINKITASDHGEDRFGIFVNVSNDTLAIAAQRSVSCDGVYSGGGVYLFKLNQPDMAPRCDNFATVNISQVSVDESSGMATARIYLSKPLSAALTLNVHSLEGSAKKASDYYGLSENITFEAGETEKLLSLNIIDDELVEFSESFKLELGAVANDQAITGREVGTVVITDNEAKPTLTIEDAVFNEGDGLVQVAVTLSAPFANDRISLRVNARGGSATAGEDYYGFSQTIELQPSQTQASIPVQILDDNASEIDESFEINILNREEVSAGGLVDVRNNATVIIVDDDSNQSRPTLSVNNLLVNERDGVVNARVTLSAPTINAVTATIHTRSITTTPGADYYGFTRPIVIAAGETEILIPVTILEDFDGEGEEYFELRLVNVDESVANVGQRVATVTIEDNEIP